MNNPNSHPLVTKRTLREHTRTIFAKAASAVLQILGQGGLWVLQVNVIRKRKLYACLVTYTSSHGFYGELAEILERLTANEELLLFHLHRLRIEREALGVPVPSMTPQFPSPTSAVPPYKTLVVAQSVDAPPAPEPQYQAAPRPQVEMPTQQVPLVAPAYTEMPSTSSYAPKAMPSTAPASADPTPAEWPANSELDRTGIAPVTRNYDYFAELDRTLDELARRNQTQNPPA